MTSHAPLSCPHQPSSDKSRITPIPGRCCYRSASSKVSRNSLIPAAMADDILESTENQVPCPTTAPHFLQLSKIARQPQGLGCPIMLPWLLRTCLQAPKPPVVLHHVTRFTARAMATSWHARYDTLLRKCDPKHRSVRRKLKDTREDDFVVMVERQGARGGAIKASSREQS